MFYSIIYYSLVLDWQPYRGGTGNVSIGKQPTPQNRSSQGKHMLTKKHPALWSERSAESSISWDAWTTATTKRPWGHPLLLRDKVFWSVQEATFTGLFPIKTCSVALSLFLKHRSGVRSAKSHPLNGIAN